MIPAPLAWLTRRSFALVLGPSSPDPLHAPSRGPHDPRSARVAHSRRSFALVLGTSSADPLHAPSRGPHDPRSARVAHSRRSFALGLGTSSADPLHAPSRGPHDPRSARVAHSRRSFATHWQTESKYLQTARSVRGRTGARRATGLASSVAVGYRCGRSRLAANVYQRSESWWMPSGMVHCGRTLHDRA